MQRFSAKHPLESVVLAFNYVLFLPPGVLLTGTPIVTVSSLYGDDPNPMGLINGPPGIDLSGTLVLQPVTAGMDANDYVVVAKCPTTNTYWTPALPAILPVRLYSSRTGAP